MTLLKLKTIASSNGASFIPQGKNTYGKIRYVFVNSKDKNDKWTNAYTLADWKKYYSHDYIEQLIRY